MTSFWGCGGMVYTNDLKSFAFGLASSTLATPTNNLLSYFSNLLTKSGHSVMGAH